MTVSAGLIHPVAMEQSRKVKAIKKTGFPMAFGLAMQYSKSIKYCGFAQNRV